MKKLLIGLAIFGLAFLIGGIIFMDTGIALCIACVALVLTPPAYDPAIIVKTRQWLAGTHPESRPTCYGDYPFLHGQTAAERSCHDCSSAYGCHEDSPDPRKRP